MHGSPLSPALSHRGAREIKTRRSKAEIERWSRQEGEMEKFEVFRMKFRGRFELQETGRKVDCRKKLSKVSPEFRQEKSWKEAA
jgi:hypothetical protein